MTDERRARQQAEPSPLDSALLVATQLFLHPIILICFRSPPFIPFRRVRILPLNVLSCAYVNRSRRRHSDVRNKSLPRFCWPIEDHMSTARSILQKRRQVPEERSAAIRRFVLASTQPWKRQGPDAWSAWVFCSTSKTVYIGPREAVQESQISCYEADYYRACD